MSSRLGPTASRMFHTSLPSYETERRRNSRLKKSDHQTKRIEKTRKANDNRPHPALGYAPGKEALWENSTLCKLLLTEEKVQRLRVPRLRLEMEPERVRVKGPDGKYVYDYQNDQPETELTGRMVPKLVNGRGVVVDQKPPNVFNYGVSQHEADLINKLSFVRLATHTIRSEELEARESLIRKIDGKPRVWSEEEESMARTSEQQEAQLNNEKSFKYWFGRVLDIKNASAQGLEFENKKRIVAAFSLQGNSHDPGLPEVQAALKTYRIHVLWGHLQTKKNDIHNRRRLVMMIQERAKILHYLRRTYRARYEALLPQLGLERGAVEGQLQLNRQLRPA